MLFVILKFSAFSLLLTHKNAYKVYNVESWFFKSFIVNQGLDEINHLSFKQKGYFKSIFKLFL